MTSLQQGYANATATGSAAALPSIPGGANYAYIRVETANIRWRDDGTNPTTTVGMLQASTDAPIVYDGNLAAFKFIAVSGSPVVHVSYYET